jgi:hypothetical protein
VKLILRAVLELLENTMNRAKLGRQRVVEETTTGPG